MKNLSHRILSVGQFKLGRRDLKWGVSSYYTFKGSKSVKIV